MSKKHSINNSGETKNIRYVKSSKKRKIILITSIATILIVSSIAIAYSIYRSNSKNTYIFLKEINQYDYSKESLLEAWPRLITKAKTPIHYLMILKRLDAFKLQEEYKKTLIRALWDFPNVHSFLALALEYYLINHEEKTIFPFLDKKVDELWNDYPNLVRLYYIRKYKKLNTKTNSDEILNIYYNLKENKYSWVELQTLWQLTDVPIFLYFAAIQANIDGNIEQSFKFYRQLPLEWQTLNIEKYKDLAWLERDKDFLLPIVKSQKNIDDYLKLAGLYIVDFDFETAYNLLELLISYYPLSIYENNAFLELYFKLVVYLEKEDKLLDSYDYMLKSNNFEVTNTYAYFLYRYNPQLFSQFLEQYQFSDQLINSSARVQFILLQINNKSIEKQKVFLWNTIHNKNIPSSVKKNWIITSALFFLIEKQFEDFKILFENYLVSYKNYADQFYFYFYARYHQNSIDKVNANEILSLTDTISYEWWHFYNVGLWSLNNHSYNQALILFNKALDLVRYEKNEKNLQYVLLQLVRTYIYKKDVFNAEYIYQRLITQFPISPYKNYLETRLKELNDSIEDSKNNAPISQEVEETTN